MTSSSGSSIPLVLDLAPARRLGSALRLVHLLTPVGVVAAGGGWFLFVVSAVGAYGSWRQTKRRHLDAGSERFVRQVRRSSDGRWSLCRRSASRDAKLLGSSLVLPWCAVLRFETGRFRRISVLIDDSALDPGAFRRLRVTLRTQERLPRGPA